MLQSENYIFTGLQQDAAVSKQQPQYLIDAHNIRITAREGETLLSITNERGPKELVIKNNIGTNVSITGTILGHCVLNNYLVLFTHEDNTGDKILRIDMSGDNPVMTTLFPKEGNQSLGFDVNHPIETIGNYENKSIQKVYWTDGLNQPRVINIIHAPYTWAGAFDFVPELALNEDVTVEKVTSASGQFQSGVIQYAFTYYNKYGQESNIFHTTPLFCTSFYDRGGSPEDKVSNAFNIRIEGVDNHFDYLRIYSILRTSINAAPVCKRVQDIALEGTSTVSYVDTGVNGDDIDPTSLLYIGGEEVIAQSICTKDSTLFLGNLKINRPSISTIPGFVTNIQNSLGSVSTVSKKITLTSVSTSANYVYSNGLNTQAAGFKNREYYRLGIQAQYKNGKWSEPVWIGDYKVGGPKGLSNYPSSYNYNHLSKIILKYAISSARMKELRDAGYKKVRPVVVFPDVQDRTIICQGVLNPTMFTTNSRTSDKDLYAQASWFFRPFIKDVYNRDDYAGSSTAYNNKICSPFSVHNSLIPYTNINENWDPKAIRSVEVQGWFTVDNQFKVDWGFATLHSPEIDLDSTIHSIDLTGVSLWDVGVARMTSCSSDIDIQTSTPAISNNGSGFTHKSFTDSSSSKGIISGLFYDDYLVDDYDKGNKFRAYDKQRNSAKWLVYPWQRNGSLNNDCNRPANSGSRSAELSKKVISNLRFSESTVWNSGNGITTRTIYDTPQVFDSNEVAIVKIGDGIYEGNIDTLLSSDRGEGSYFAFGTPATLNGVGTVNITDDRVITEFDSISWWKTWSNRIDGADEQGTYKRTYKEGEWKWRKTNSDISDYVPALAIKKDAVRMKYKSTPHIVLKCSAYSNLATTNNPSVLPVVELCRKYNAKTMFGGQTLDALRANVWVPAGKAISTSSTNISLVFEYGDTWYSRYDCLKTYPFTKEDPNQIVEIGSFMLETRLNIDGRYDRNRGQMDNTNMSPTNFNLFNPVYSQRDNFFSYRILDDDFYKLNEFPNQITWSTEKSQGSDIDPWTSITLASVYSMDGSKGKIRSLNTWNDNIYCFQDSGISCVLFNSRVQIPTSDGVPIEISNNYKVEGKRYISDGVGCINKYTICPTPQALYFIDSVGGHLQAINANGLADLSLQKNMVTWLSKQNTSIWKPNDYTTKVFYDKNNNDLYIITKTESLCYNEIVGQFVSYMPYSNSPAMFNIVDKFYCIKNNYLNEMFAGYYNYFFGEYHGYDLTFVSNGSSNGTTPIDKIFNNIDFRADRWSDKLDSILSTECPFDYIRMWDEYQDTGEVLLKNKGNIPSNLKKKFRVWRMQVPRDAHNRRDRIRNTWCKIKLGAAPRYNNGNNGFIQFHDANVQYFI